MSKRKLIIFITTGILLILIGVIGAYCYRTYRGYGDLSITIAPADLKYTVGKKTYIGDQNKIKLATGKYTINFSGDLYESQTKTVEIKKNQSESFTIVLKLKETYNQNYYSLEQTEKNQIDAYNDKVAEIDTKDFLNKNPLASVLPHITDTYRIDYGFVKDSIYYEMTLYKASANYNKDLTITEAKKWVKDQGFNPSDYNFKITEE